MVTKLQIKKRNGQVVDFDETKIIRAIQKAHFEVYPSENGPEYAAAIAKGIKNRLQYDDSIYTVEDIQDLVESYLMQLDPQVARTYIRFRYKKEVIREGKAFFFKDFSKKLNAEDVVNQNANVDEYSFGGRIGEASDSMMKEYALNFCVSEMAKNNHLKNMIYIHDLNSYAVGNHNCLSIPFDSLFEKGFNTRQVDIRPANSVDTAFQLLAVIFQLQSLQQFGGVSATHLDWTMVPYVRKSYWKHYIDGVKYFCPNMYQTFKGDLKELDTSKLPIEDYTHSSVDDKKWNGQFHQYYKDHLGDATKQIEQYALEMTERELNQAVEGMYHNLKKLG